MDRRHAERGLRARGSAGRRHTPGARRSARASGSQCAAGGGVDGVRDRQRARRAKRRGARWARGCDCLPRVTEGFVERLLLYKSMASSRTGPLPHRCHERTPSYVSRPRCASLCSPPPPVLTRHTGQDAQPPPQLKNKAQAAARIPLLAPLPRTRCRRPVRHALHPPRPRAFQHDRPRCRHRRKLPPWHGGFAQGPLYVPGRSVLRC